MPLKWSEKSEQKLSGVIQGALNIWQLDGSEPHGIMVGSDMEVQYSHIDSAEQNFSILSSQLRDLKTELGDVGGSA